LAALSPAMSSKVTLTEVVLSNLRPGLLRKPPSGPPAPSIPRARRDIQLHAPMMSTQGSSVSKSCTANGCCWLLTSILTPLSRKKGSSAASFWGRLVRNVVIGLPPSVSGLASVPSTVSPAITTASTFPARIHS